ncbi:MAG: hypothetical protein ACTS2F_23365 [Thainema sp.]
MDVCYRVTPPFPSTQNTFTLVHSDLEELCQQAETEGEDIYRRTD